MRIAISGSSNCGKSTLAGGLSNALGMPVIDEFRGEPFPAGPGLSQEREMDRFEAILRTKSAHEDTCGKGFVADRSSIDLAYAWLIRALPLSFPDRSRVFLSSCRDRAATYDAVIFPPGPSPEQGMQNYFGKPERVWEMWRNHNALIGLTSRWLPEGRLIVIPEDVQGPDERVEWVSALLGRAGRGSSA